MHTWQSAKGVQLPYLALVIVGIVGQFGDVDEFHVHARTWTADVTAIGIAGESAGGHCGAFGLTVT